jgi:hypothetical protein
MKSFRQFMEDGSMGTSAIATSTAGVKATGDDTTVPVSKKMQQQYKDVKFNKSSYKRTVPTVALSTRANRVKEVKEDNSDLPWKEDPKNPTRPAGVRKDKFGNVVKNVPKFLARAAMNTMAKEESPRRVTGGINVGGMPPAETFTTKE